MVHLTLDNTTERREYESYFCLAQIANEVKNKFLFLFWEVSDLFQLFLNTWLDTLPENPSFGHKKSPVGAGTPSGLNQHKG
jgi:hypothetical protein